MSFGTLNFLHECKQKKSLLEAKKRKIYRPQKDRLLGAALLRYRPQHYPQKEELHFPQDREILHNKNITLVPESYVSKFLQ